MKEINHLLSGAEVPIGWRLSGGSGHQVHCPAEVVDGLGEQPQHHQQQAELVAGGAVGEQQEADEAHAEVQHGPGAAALLEEPEEPAQQVARQNRQREVGLAQPGDAKGRTALPADHIGNINQASVSPM